MRLGRGTTNEVQALEYGMDFRCIEFRREVFHRFYEFHLKYRSHPGCVYYLMPYLAQRLGWSTEDKLWFAYLNGNTQNPLTSLQIFKAFPSLDHAREPAFTIWFRKHYGALAFDTDRRYHKKRLPEAIVAYRRAVGTRTQEAFYAQFCCYHDDAESNFRALWQVSLGGGVFKYFGRLSAFSFLEYLSISGLQVACDRLFLEDMDGSKSHRNGLCKVLGRDDLDWHDSNTGFAGYTASGIGWFADEGQALLDEARARAQGMWWAPHVNYFTLESALCTYKSWHRPNRRYPNVYNDMLRDRILTAERAGQDCSLFWEARTARLPQYLLLEYTPNDPGCVPLKQNHYLKTGQVIMLDREWPCFKNDFNDRVNAP